MQFFNDRKAYPNNALRQNRLAALLIGLGVILLACATFFGFTGYRILVAEPRVIDKNFAQTIVLVLRRDLATQGVILNRALTQEQTAQLPAAMQDHNVNYGGPIGFPDTITILVWRPITPTEPAHYGFVFWNSAQANRFERLQERLTQLQAQGYRTRLFAGHAAWVPLQLEMEMWAARFWRVYQPTQLIDKMEGLLDGSAADWAALRAK